MQTTAVFRAGAAGPRVGHGGRLGCQRAHMKAFSGVAYSARTFTAAAPRSLASDCTRRRARRSAAQLEEASTQGVDSSTIDWRAQWYPVTMERDLWKDRPNVVTVLGERLVVWWSPNESRWRCFRDQCPHRLVPLSEGRINPEGTLECPYHGWSFQGDGRCVHIPQGGELAQRRACTVAYACVLKQGMVWVKLVEVQRDKQGRPVAHAEVTEEDEASIPIIPEIEEDRDSWIVFEAHRDLPLDWSTVLENVLDAGHVPYTHHKTISRRERACSMFDLRVTVRGGFGPELVLQQPSSNTLEQRSFRVLCASFPAPTAGISAALRVRLQKGQRVLGSDPINFRPELV